VQAFEVLEGRKPSSADELAGAQGITLSELPEGYSYGYDPETGKSSIRKGENVVCE
jgi:hypothetical protein